MVFIIRPNVAEAFLRKNDGEVVHIDAPSLRAK